MSARRTGRAAEPKRGACAPGDRIEVVVTELDEDGAGVGTTAGAPAAGGAGVSVFGGLPGERLLAQVEHVSPHTGHVWASALRVLEPSAERVAPACPAHGRCGGCILQSFDYPAQLEWKRRRIRRALAERAAGFEVEVEPVRPSPRVLGYRNRAKLVAAPGPGGRLVLGAYRMRTHEVVDLLGCKVVEPPIDPIAQGIAARAFAEGVPAFDERTRRGLLRHVVIRSSHDGRVLVTLVVHRFTHGAMPAALALARSLCAQRPEVAGVVAHANDTTGGALFARTDPAEDRVLAGDASFLDRIGDVEVEVPARAFLQVNREQAARLYGRIAEAVGDARAVLDAYAGVGVEALYLARRAGSVVAVEADPGAVAALTRNAARAGEGRVEVLAGEAAGAMAELAVRSARFDVAVVDPPRKGLAGALAPLVRLAPPRILYVSCSPESLASDLAALAQAGYRAAGPLVPFDLFPGTPHVEMVAELALTPPRAPAPRPAGPPR